MSTQLDAAAAYRWSTTEREFINLAQGLAADGCKLCSMKAGTTVLEIACNLIHIFPSMGIGLPSVSWLCCDDIYSTIGVPHCPDILFLLSRHLVPLAQAFGSPCPDLVPLAQAFRHLIPLAQHSFGSPCPNIHLVPLAQAFGSPCADIWFPLPRRLVPLDQTFGSPCPGILFPLPRHLVPLAQAFGSPCPGIWFPLPRYLVPLAHAFGSPCPDTWFPLPIFNIRPYRVLDVFFCTSSLIWHVSKEDWKILDQI